MTTPAETAPAPAPEEPAERRKSPLAYVGQIGGIVALVASVVGLLFVFKPGWQPKPPPDVGTLKIVDSSVRQPVTFGRYLERVRLPALDVTKAFRQRQGLLIEFDYEAEGFRGKRLPIQWELVDAKTNDRVRTGDDDASGNDAVGIKPSTNQETAKWFVWVPAPKTGRDYYVTVTIYQPRKGDVDVALADFDTATFPGSAT